MLLQYFFADNSDFAPRKTPLENMKLSLKSIEKMLLDVAVFSFTYIQFSNNTNIAHKENIIIDSSSVDICLSSGTAVIINK
ncbi:hypothetical protein T4B_5970 [Trichinella pseudospiralis]|uniref:Uncharacterized protein n=1 Tax=Trichinella pseudospiralis TaxID=6337 RepID=A0A0V1JE51_TRIPS|nr:hypothetical protein T4B_5970 [Trichinella pseudospiralis]KRZ33231.1 hypothetical protein T4C_11672 [Trichinella pseudospiralis]